jgi:SagB-type dehydrogenase family enzyme
MSPAWFEGLTGEDAEACFEFYHENSKIGRRHRLPPRDEIGAQPSVAMRPVVFAGDLVAELGEPDRLDAPTVARTVKPGPMGRKTLSALLLHACAGRRNAGLVDPLEIFVNVAAVNDLPAGLCHYDPLRNAATLLVGGDRSAAIAGALLGPERAAGSAVQIFVTAVFDRLAVSRGERGYRDCLIEAGRFAERLDRAAAGLGLAAVAIGDFYDREIDRLLGLDGVTAGTLAVIAVGPSGDAAG